MPMVCNVRRSERDKKIGRRYRVLADGVDITDTVFYVDARRRIVRRYLRNSDGNFYLMGRDVAWETLRPRRVRLVRK